MTLSLEQQTIFAETVQRAQQQQPEAMAQLMMYIEQLARKSFGDFSVAQADCEDLIQDVMIAIYQKLQSEHFYLGIPFEHYINRTIYRRKVDYRRRKLTHQRIFEDYVQGYAFRYQNQLEQQQRYDRYEIEALLQQVSEQLSAFEMRVLEGLIQEWKPAEIAQALATRDKKVYNAIYRIRQKMKCLLDA
ncbi:sigma-70 family RNA polymerase sigma factor [Staphylococcus lutrae]|uniref:RNA polymerase subunit sigma n=1 Tax=Staphylococcus lutrae TaxID=155085 RepID=A0AAC9RNX3_9STAP|nr:sigma-70 family RNA polymerase sigma factor [Staphylococcus lutrae]ARJ51083.1 RNA polymerase subunit sigma [Staphylococcus lutrae]PNZ38291.1 sigma-70 family RNA polymerase sigma factor [Staphylococcus lutrae]